MTRPDSVVACVRVISVESCKTFAMPKSSTQTPRSLRMMFEGLRSRWTIPSACASDSTSQISDTMRTARPGSNCPSRASVSARVEPSTYSMTMKGRPSARCPASKIIAPRGCLSRAIVRASRMKRSAISGCAANSCFRILMATGRSSPRWEAR
jgi:hypothetical protein